MTKPETPPVSSAPESAKKDFPELISEKERRRIHAEQQERIGPWYGLGVFGQVGWTVVLPTLLGIGAGLWIDIQWPSRHSWTLMLMVAGLGCGCLLAGRWVNRQRRRILKEREKEQQHDQH